MNAPQDLGDDERTPDDPELEETQEPAGEDDDVQAHSRPLPPRPMNGL
jgi:hypothetical protein